MRATINVEDLQPGMTIMSRAAGARVVFEVQWSHDARSLSARITDDATRAQDDEWLVYNPDAKVDILAEPLLTVVTPKGPAVDEEWTPEPDHDFVCERVGCRRAASWRLRDMPGWADDCGPRYLCDKHVPRG